jgi:hypothetical protein
MSSSSQALWCCQQAWLVLERDGRPGFFFWPTIACQALDSTIERRVGIPLIAAGCYDYESSLQEEYNPDTTSPTQ